MSEFVETFRVLLMQICLCIVLAGFAAVPIGAAMPTIREHWRRMSRSARLLAVAFVAAFTVYAVLKPVRNAGADAEVGLVAVEAGYDETNDVSAVVVRFTGDVAVDTPVWVRNDATEQWRELEKVNADITTDFATNSLSFAVSGNSATNMFWWVGHDTPAVIVETTGITITHFAASSQMVQIMWACDDPKAETFEVQRRRKREREWETVGVTSSLAYVYVGFTVGETWEWRVMSTYTEGE